MCASASQLAKAVYKKSSKKEKTTDNSNSNYATATKSPASRFSPLYLFITFLSRATR
jgi:hypothetical protein